MPGCSFRCSCLIHPDIHNLKVLDRLLEKLKSRGHRVVLFSQFNIMLDVIEDYLIYRGYKYR